jgi:hypothetical protein
MHDPAHEPSPALRRLGIDLDTAMRRQERSVTAAPARWARVVPRRARPSLALALAVAAAAVAVAVLVAPRSTSPTGVQSAGAAVMMRLARLAARQPAYAPGPGQYLHTVSRKASELVLPTPRGAGVCRMSSAERLEDWVAADGAGLRREMDTPPRYASHATQAACRRSPYHVFSDGRPVKIETLYGPKGLLLSTVDFAKLPLDPHKLRDRLLTGKVEGGPPGVAEAFGQVADLLSGTDAPPRVRAALFHAAAALPGIKSLGTVTDGLGRKGLALELHVRSQISELVFNARTSALMDERSARLDVPGGPVVDSTSYVTSEVVNGLPVHTPLPPRGASRKLSAANVWPEGADGIVLMPTESKKSAAVQSPR